MYAVLAAIGGFSNSDMPRILILSFVISITSAALLVRATVMLDTLKLDDEVMVMNQQNRTISSLNHGTAMAQLYFISEDPVYYLRYWQNHDEGIPESVWDWTEHAIPEAVTPLYEIRRIVDSYRKDQYIALELLSLVEQETKGLHMLIPREEHVGMLFLIMGKAPFDI